MNNDDTIKWKTPFLCYPSFTTCIYEESLRGVYPYNIYTVYSWRWNLIHYILADSSKNVKRLDGHTIDMYNTYLQATFLPQRKYYME